VRHVRKYQPFVYARHLERRRIRAETLVVSETANPSGGGDAKPTGPDRSAGLPNERRSFS
jgi:hypothetical protein